jgi:hypothetical protein
MTNQSVIKKAVAGAVLAGAFSLTSIFGGVASADTPPVSEIVVTKATDATSPSLGGGDVDGRDFLTWQRGNSPSAGANGGIWRTTNFDTAAADQ